MSEVVDTTTVDTQTVVEPVLSPEELAADALKSRVKLLQVKIEEIVTDLIKNTDFTVEEFGYATDLFKGWVTILTHSTEQYNTLLKADDDANVIYLKTKLSDLISIRTPDENAQTTQAVGS